MRTLYETTCLEVDRLRILVLLMSYRSTASAHGWVEPWAPFEQGRY
jgi:hypothetical protein